MSVWLECPVGHSWQVEEIDPRDDSRCPVCSLPGILRGNQTVTTAPPPRESEAEALPSLPGFEVVRELGRGGMGVVYLARQETLGRLVAVKVIRSSDWASGDERQRFVREARLVAQMDHPGIVRCHTIGEHGGCPYFAMEYVEGGSLADRLDGKPWPIAEAVRLVERLARALQHAHERGIVHRDLKPANVLLFSGVSQNHEGEGLVPKVTDFGLAKRMEGMSALTNTGAVLGTPSYMAPEQAGGKRSEVGPATDVHALGVLLYELLTGKRPFPGEMLVDILWQVRDLSPVPPRRLRPEIPPGLEAICLKCLAKRPAERYPTAGPLAEDLGACLSRSHLTAGRVRRWRGLVLAAVLVVAAAGILAWLLRQGNKGGEGAGPSAEAGTGRNAGPGPAVGSGPAAGGESPVRPSIAPRQGAPEPEPDLVVVRPPRDREARLAVQFSRDVFEKAVAEKVAIAIVLDCSGSMVTNKLPGTDTTRWDAVKMALRKAMQEMPAGVFVSLRAFGDKEGIEATEDIKPAHGKWAKFKQVWKAHRWNPYEVQDRLTQVDNLRPSGTAPLVRAMWMARQDFPRDFKGRRILVVVTDGGDTNFYDLKEDVDAPLKENTGAKTLGPFLMRAFKGDKRFHDIEVDVIGFDFRPVGSDDTPATLRAAAEMPKAVRAIRGEYHYVRDGTTLARKLTGALLDVTFVAEADDSRSDGRGTISSTGAGSLRWLDLPADRYPEYTVRFPAIPGFKGNVSLQPGDRLALELVPGDRLPKLRRMLYARSPFLKGFHGVDGRMVTVKHEDETWVAAGLQNYMRRGAGNGRLSLLATLEQEQGPQQSDRYIQTVRPRWTWFEVHGPKGQAAEVRVFPVGDYPAPAWGLEVADWPSRDDPVRINAWWTARSFTRLALRHTLGPGQSVLNLKEKPWDDRPEKDAITIESVRLEPCSLRLPREGKEGLDQAEVRNCLVVRLRYPKDPAGSRPIFVQPGEREWGGGQAHRWFHQAGKYTGIFWPATEKTAAEIRELLLFSVPELKAKSVSATLEMGEPDSESMRPGIP
jgi:hypothetical protein